MGMGFIVIYPAFSAVLSQEAILLLLIGGAFYLIGIVFFIAGVYRPIYHSVWHLFVVAAAATHWFDVYFYVVQVMSTTTSSDTVSCVVCLYAVD